jgi:hypothetical protein
LCAQVSDTDSNIGCHHGFCPVSRFRSGELDEALQRMDSISLAQRELGPSFIDRSKLAQNINATRELPRLRSDQFSEFESYWSAGIPVVITDVKLQGNWTPESFRDSESGNLNAKMIDSRETKPKSVKVRRFFEIFLDREGRSGATVKLKVLRSTFMLSYIAEIIKGLPSRRCF